MAVHEVSVFTSQLLTLAAMCKTHSIDNYYSCPSNLLINDFLDSIEYKFLKYINTKTFESFESYV